MAVRKSLATSLVAIGLLACGGSTTAPRVRTQFLSGTAAPSGLTFASFGRAAANAHGTGCFLAGWDGLRHRPEGLYLRRGGQVTPIARAGDLIPGRSGDRFSFSPDYPDDFASFSLNQKDEVAFIARQGLFLYSGGAVRPIARVGDPVPGVLDELWDEIDTVALNSSGVIAFTGAVRSVSDGERQEGVFLISGDSVKIALFDGDQPGDLEGTLNSFAAVSMNEAGDLAVLATEGDDNLGCILTVTSAQTRVVAVEGRSAPGGTWSYLGSVAINSSGSLAFQGKVTDDTGEHAGIFRAAAGAVTPAAIPGDPIGADGSVTIGDSLARPIIDDAGTVAFLAQIRGSRASHGIVLAQSGKLSTLATEGSPVSGSAGTISRFAGLSLGSFGPDGLVCGVALAGASPGSALVRLQPGAAAEPLVTSDAPLPPGSVLTLSDGETASRNVQARINRSGALVFAADVGGYGRALFRQGATGPELLTPLNGMAPGDPAIQSVVSFDLNDAGQIAVLGTRDQADGEMAIFALDLQQGSVPRTIAASGSPVPGSSDRTLTRLGPPALDGNGGVLFAAVGHSPSVPLAADRSFLLRSRGQDLEALAAEGQIVEGAGTLASPPGSDRIAVTPLFRELHVNTAGQALFTSGYLDQRTKAYNTAGLFMLAGGELRAAVLPGQPAPLPGAPVYTSFVSPRLDDNGAITFGASVAGAGRKPRSGLFRRDGSGTVTLAVTGDPVPGWDGSSYRALLDPATNDAGSVAFLGLVDPPPAAGTAAAVFVSAGSTATTALLDGDPVNAGGASSIRVDDRLPPAPLALQEDGTLLVATRLRGSDAPDGLFLVPLH